MITELQRLVAHAVLLNSALYLTGCFVAGLVLGNGWAWRLALAAAGVTYLCYTAQSYYLAENATGVGEPNDWGNIAAVVLLFASIALGALAGLALLF